MQLVPVNTFNYAADVSIGNTEYSSYLSKGEMLLIPQSADFCDLLISELVRSMTFTLWRRSSSLAVAVMGIGKWIA